MQQKVKQKNHVPLYFRNVVYSLFYMFIFIFVATSKFKSKISIQAVPTYLNHFILVVLGLIAIFNDTCISQYLTLNKEFDNMTNEFDH